MNECISDANRAIPTDTVHGDTARLLALQSWQASLLSMDDLHAAFAQYIEHLVQQNDELLLKQPCLPAGPGESDQESASSPKHEPVCPTPPSSQPSLTSTPKESHAPKSSSPSDSGEGDNASRAPYGHIFTLHHPPLSAGREAEEKSESAAKEVAYASQTPPHDQQEKTSIKEGVIASASLSAQQRVQHGLQTPVTPDWVEPQGSDKATSAPHERHEAVCSPSSTLAIPSGVPSCVNSPCTKPSSPAPMVDVPTRFHSKAPPAISISDYVSRIAKYACIDRSLLLMLMVYLDRIHHYHPEFHLTSLTVHRFLIAAVTCCAKTCFDSYCSNSHYAKVGGLSRRELNMLELEFLFLINFDLLVVDPATLLSRHEILAQMRRA